MLKGMIWKYFGLKFALQMRRSFYVAVIYHPLDSFYHSNKDFTNILKEVLQKASLEDKEITILGDITYLKKKDQDIKEIIIVNGFRFNKAN